MLTQLKIKRSLNVFWAMAGGRKNMKGGFIRDKVFVYIRIFAFFVFSYIPVFVFAAEWKVGDEPTNLTQFVNNFTSILNVLVPFLMGFGFFGFVTGVLKYVNAGGDEERLGKAKQLIAYGLVGMLIMFSFWGLAKILSGSYLGEGI